MKGSHPKRQSSYSDYSMVRLSKRKLCSVHNDKPEMCSMIPTSAVHEKTGRTECIHCGNCCQLSARFFGKAEDRNRVIGEIRKRSEILDEHGLDVEGVIEFIFENDRIPQRGEIGLDEEDTVFKRRHCCLLVTDDLLEDNPDYEYD
jgi:hypothetical protein